MIKSAFSVRKVRDINHVNLTNVFTVVVFAALLHTHFMIVSHVNIFFFVYVLFTRPSHNIWVFNNRTKPELVSARQMGSTTTVNHVHFIIEEAAV